MRLARRGEPVVHQLRQLGTLHGIEDLYAGRADHQDLLGDAVGVHRGETPLAEIDLVHEHQAPRFGRRPRQAGLLVQGPRRRRDFGNHEAFFDRDPLVGGGACALLGHQ